MLCAPTGVALTYCGLQMDARNAGFPGRLAGRPGWLDEWCFEGGVLHVTIHITKWQGVLRVWCGGVLDACLMQGLPVCDGHISITKISFNYLIVAPHGLSPVVSAAAAPILSPTHKSILTTQLLMALKLIQILSWRIISNQNKHKSTSLYNCSYTRAQIKYIMLGYAASHFMQEQDHYIAIKTARLTRIYSLECSSVRES